MSFDISKWYAKFQIAFCYGTEEISQQLSLGNGLIEAHCVNTFTVSFNTYSI